MDSFIFISHLYLYLQLLNRMIQMVGHGVSLCDGQLDLPKRGLPGTAIPCITAAGGCASE